MRDKMIPGHMDKDKKSKLLQSFQTLESNLDWSC